MAREFNQIGVIGLGTMGAGIAEVFARNGFSVVGVEQTEEQAQRGRGHIQNSTDRAVRRAKLTTDEPKALLDRIVFTTTMAGVADCDLVVEAVVEGLDLKRDVMSRLDRLDHDGAGLATSTYSLS